MIDIEELINPDSDSELVFIGDTPDRYKDAIVGVTNDMGQVVYSYDKLVEVMARVDGMTHEEAEDWVSYNTARSLAYQDEHAPILMWDIEQ